MLKRRITKFPEENIIQYKNKDLINFKDLPPSVLNNFDDNNFVKNKAAKNSSPFGEVNTKVPSIKSIDKNGTISYTIELKKAKATNKLKAEADLYFDNVIVNQKENGDEKIYIIRYLPETNWYFNESNNFSNYAGEIIIFDAQGKLLGETQVKNGTDTKTDIPNAKAMTCTFALKTTLCTGGMNGEPYSCTSTYELDSCSEDTTGGDATTADPNQYEGSTPDDTSTGGSSTDPDTTTTTPIIEEPCYNAEGIRLLKDSDGNCILMEEEDKINTDYLNNDCVEGILIELQEKDDHYYVIPELGAEVSHLSQIILDLFDNSSKLNLTFKIDDLGAVNAKTNPDVLAGDYTITLDDTYVQNGTQLAIARTIIHESVHAWLSYLNQGPPSDLKTELLTYLQNNGYDYEDAQHMLMSDYAPALASSIAAWDNYQLVDSSTINEFNYYNALSFSGEMLNSTGFNQLSPSEQQMVLDANKKEGDAVNPSASDAKGSKCP